MSIDPDRELVKRCQTLGSQEFELAFGQLYDSYKDRVYSLAYRITGNATEALDAAQESFILLYQKIETFKFDSKFSSWLYRLVVNASIDHLRRVKSRRWESDSSLSSPFSSSPTTSRHDSPSSSGTGSSLSPEPSTGEPLHLPSDPAEGPERRAQVQDQADAIQIGINQLSDKLKVITVLRYQQNLSYEELGEILEISPGTVKSRLARAHIALSKHLAHLAPSLETPALEGPALEGPALEDGSQTGGIQATDPKGDSHVS